MKRRAFLKNSAAGTAFLSVSGVCFFSDTLAGNNPLSKYAFQSNRQLPVAYDVDVAIAGGTSAAVAAAVSAARAGASVFLAAPEPYLGEDICGTYRFWANPVTALQTELGRKIFGDGLPTPMHVKKTLDNELISNHIDFLYSSYITDLISGTDGNPAGFVIANRSGRQAIRAKVVIDATPRGQLARMAGAAFSRFPAGIQEFRHIVVGNQPKDIDGALRTELPAPVVFKDKTYTAWEYALKINMPDDSWQSFCHAEHIARDLTWDPDQVDSGDLLFQVPPVQIEGQRKWNQPDVDPENMSIRVFQPRKVDRMFVLSGVADMTRESAGRLLEPGGLIRAGERVGQAAAAQSVQIAATQKSLIRGSKASGAEKGDVGEILEGLRPSLNQGELSAEDTSIPVLGTYDVVVLGGGTAGAPAGIGASRHGAGTLVLEYLHGLGGTGTLGMIGRYWDGYREGFTVEVDKGVKAIGGDNPRQKKRLDEWVFDWKTEYFRKEIRKSGGEIWFGVLGIGAYVDNGTVKGVVIATPEGKGVVLANTVIDSTGSADIAIAAGSGYEYTDGLSVAIQGAGMPFRNPNDHYNNTDWTFTNDTDMLDVWRTFIVAKDKFGSHYDLGKLPQTRERRRMTGDYTVSVLDVYNGRTYPDTFSVHQSSFDTHGYTEDPFFSLKPPAERNYHVRAYVPLRALLPKGIEGIAVTGLGASAHRDAMPVIRMQPCLQNQGYSMGWAAALAAANKQKIRDIDLKWLQRGLVEMKNLPEEVLTFTDNYPPSLERIQNAAKNVVNDLKDLEILLWDTERSVPVLEDHFHMSQHEEHRLVYARILGMLGFSAGWQVISRAVDGYDDWDEGWNFRGMGQFGKSISYLDSLIIALGRTRQAEALPSILRLAKKLTPESEFSHFHAVAIALEAIASQDAAETLYQLLQMHGVTGHAMVDIETSRRLTPASHVDNSTRNNSLRELILGRALFKVGDHNGLGKQILDTYSKDLRGHYYRHASGVLQMFSKPAQPAINL